MHTVSSNSKPPTIQYILQYYTLYSNIYIILFVSIWQISKRHILVCCISNFQVTFNLIQVCPFLNHSIIYNTLLHYHLSWRNSKAVKSFTLVYFLSIILFTIITIVHQFNSSLTILFHFYTDIQSNILCSLFLYTTLILWFFFEENILGLIMSSPDSENNPINFRSSSHIKHNFFENNF